MIIIEGPDGSGKTKLAGLLAKLLGIEVTVGAGRYMPISVARQAARKQANSVRRRDKYIWDRCALISAAIYGQIMTGQSLITSFEISQLARVLYAADMPVLYCRPPNQTIIENVEKAGLFSSLDRLDLIVNAYDSLISQFPHALWDYTGESSTLTVQQIAALYEEKFNGSGPKILILPVSTRLLVTPDDRNRGVA